MNNVNLIGRLTKDPEIKNSEKGKVTARFTLAVSKRNGEADYIPIVAFDKGAEFAEKYFCKGLRVAVFGRISTGSYVNKEGKKIYTIEVVADIFEFADGKRPENGKRLENDKKDVAAPEIKNIPESKKVQEVQILQSVESVRDVGIEEVNEKVSEKIPKGQDEKNKEEQKAASSFFMDEDEDEDLLFH